MENRKFIKFLIPIFVLGFFINVSDVFAYDIETHAYLTGEIFDFYNKNFSNQKISDELKNYLIDGARREDDPIRWMNHFYDPVYNRGLTVDSKIFSARDIASVSLVNVATLGSSWLSSKEWAQNSDNQNKFKYSPVIATALSSFQSDKIQKYFSTSDFSWDAAINYWVNDNKEMAIFALGHILHLIEDASVPDHTRNDPHPGDSPYELYTQQFTLENKDKDLEKRLSDKKPIILDNLNSYFNKLAKYSNNNFYSKDTIGIQSGYELPEPDYTLKEGDYFYGYKIDNENGDYKIFIKEKQSLFGELIVNKNDISLLINKAGGDGVINDYWSRLSAKSIQYGSGVINLFFQEAEKAKKEQKIAEKDDKPAFFAQIISSANNIAGNISSFFYDEPQNLQINNNPQNAFQKIENVQKNEQTQNEIQPPQTEIENKSQNKTQDEIPAQTGLDPVKTEMINQSLKQLVKKVFPEQKQIELISALAKTENIKIDQQPTQKIQQTQKNLSLAEEDSDSESQDNIENNQSQIASPKCDFSNSTNRPATRQIIFNEIAWMGNSANPRGEWIELKNLSNAEINLASWQILNKKSNIKITFSNDDKISPNGFYLLERASDSSAAEAKADKIYNGAISNSDEGLKIFNNQCGLIDEALAQPNWPAGDNSSKKTMERKNNFSWQTSLYINGTPKKENSQENSQTATYSGGGGGGGGGVSATTAPSQTPPSQGNSQIQNSTSTATSTTSTINYIVISEIYPDKTSNNFDFVELYNPTNSSIELRNYSLKILKEGSTSTDPLSSFSTNNIIASKSFFLIGLDNYNQSTSTAADVSRSSYSLTTTKAATVILYNGSNSVDEINYNPSNLANGQSLERKSFATSTVDSMTAGEHRFSGNGYDTDISNDFILRNSAEPQNSQNFPEPRERPTAPQNFAITYASSSLALNFSWNASQDYSNATSTISYKITDANASSTFSTITTTSTIAAITINENNFNKIYNFLIQAFDRENLNSSSTQKEISIPNSNLTIAKQLDKSISEQGDGNGQFYQVLGNGLLGSPQSVKFHTKFVDEGVYGTGFFSQANFWASDNPDYSSSALISTNGCYRVGNYGAPYGIADGNCDNLNIPETNIDKDYTIPIQQPFNFNPSKYYKLKFLTYINHSIFYGSNNSASYIYGKSTKNNGQGAEIDTGMKNLYFSIDAAPPIEIPINIFQSTPQNFELSYSTSTLTLSLNWNKPRYFDGASPTLTYRINDVSSSVSSSTLVLPEITTSATSTTINITEVGRKYKFSIQGFDANGSSTLATISKEIYIPYSLFNQFIITKQTDYSVSEAGSTHGRFYQTLGNGLSGKLGAITMKINVLGNYLQIYAYQYSDPNYSNLESNQEIAFCTTDPQHYPGRLCSDNYMSADIIAAPVKNEFIFDPLKYYKLNFIDYRLYASDQSIFYGSSDANSYANGQSTKNDQGSEIATSPLKDLYFVILSSTPH